MRLIYIFILFININLVLSQDISQLKNEDKIRIKEAEDIESLFGNSVWENWNKIPFTYLFISPDTEYLIGYAYKPEGFKDSGYDTLLQSELFTRARKFNTNFFATFGAIDSIPVIVVGAPENTGYSGSRWIITLLHEHFHQYQYSQPDYYSSVKALDLAGDDKTGMWMLNYPFPYSNSIIGAEYGNFSALAEQTAFAQDNIQFDSLLKIFLNEWKHFESLLNEKDYSYMSFQLWQEGIARYTEYKITASIKDKYNSPEQVHMLNDYMPYDSLYNKMISDLKKEVESVKLDNEKRVCFYSLGAIIGLILDRANPNWRSMYFKEKFYLEKYF